MILGEYLVGVIVILMLSGGTALEQFASRHASSVLDALARRVPDAAIRIERLWDEVGKIYEMDILCGYALNSFHGEEDQHIFQSICAEQTSVYSQ